ncbi:NAD(P)-dependent oxidoreductase [Streptomyces blastmyceticus]|uniref:D-3-phosphoglycerate dehydrogenase n=1 Tax=Streptomyces blastmyceticus TaxID=68180 RepID=A0ABP3G9B3_9ACTN
MSGPLGPLVLVEDGLLPAAVDGLGPECRVRTWHPAAPGDRTALRADLAEAEALIAGPGTPVGAELIDAAPRLRVVAVADAGAAGVDLAAATRSGVAVVTSPAPAATVAHSTAALLLARAGSGNGGRTTGVDLTGRVLGVVGRGAVGRRVAELMSAFGMNVLTYEPGAGAEQAGAAAQDRVVAMELGELVRRSDYVTVHLGPTAHSVGLLGDEALRRLRAAVAPGVESPGSTGLLDSLLDSLADPSAESVSLRHIQPAAVEFAALAVRCALRGEPAPGAVNIPAGSVPPAVSSRLPAVRRLGQFAGALTGAGVRSLGTEFHGPGGEESAAAAELAALAGLLTAAGGPYPSYVEVAERARRRGIASSATARPAPEPAVHVRLTCGDADGGTIRLAAALHGPGRPARLTEVSGTPVDLALGDRLLALRHHDRPGILAAAAGALAAAGLDIDCAQAVPVRPRGDALVLLTVSGPVGPALLADVVRATGARAGWAAADGTEVAPG